MAGPVDLAVHFFRSETGGSPPLGEPGAFPAVTLQEGVFQLTLDLSVEDYRAIFPSAETAAYIEITDQTNARTFPRQRFTVVPLAARVPVDGSTVTFDDNGRLTATLPAAGATTPGVIKATNAFVEVDAAAGVVIYAADYKWLCLARVTLQGASVAAKAVRRYVEACFRRKKPLTMGQALAAGLRVALTEADVPVWLDTPLIDLSVDEAGRVEGVRVRRGGVETVLKAKHGVIIATGGFERNLAMRLQYQRRPIGVDWTLGVVENTGDGILAGQRLGADLALMDDAWWGPSVPLAPGQPYFCLSERSLPGSIMVNARGERFVNESAPYHDVVNAMYQQALAADGSGVWLVTDQNYRNRYLFRDVLPGLALPQAWFDQKAVYKATTLRELAQQIHVPADQLEATVQTFNGFARAGEDPDFRRGANAYDRYYSDPGVKPNPSLGELRKAPFYAFRIVPGDLGTKGGLRTDGRARVLRADGSPIEGLYAAGNASAAVMGRSYAGNGSTLGPAMTFGFVAANDIAARLSGSRKVF